MGSSHGTQQVVALLILCSILCLASSAASNLPEEYSIIRENELEGIVSEERVVELFRRWKEKHGKVYRSAGDAEKRLESFKRNLKYVLEKNARMKAGGPAAGKESRVGLNKFADLSNEEFREMYLSKVKKPASKRWGRQSSSLKRQRRRQLQRLGSCDSAPATLDWRNYGIVTAMKDQGSCGSCWAFSSTGAMEGINALKTGELISLSEQELVDCDTTNDGCDGGYMDYAFEWVINNGGIDSGADYPYTSTDGVDGTCNVTKEENDKVVSIDGYVDVEETDSALFCAVVQQPVSVGMDGSAMDFQLYTGGIYAGSCSDDPDDIDHAVLIVGYASEGDENYWIVKNSWGTDWGMDGYFYLLRNTSLPFGQCAVNAMASYPTKESSAPSPYPSPVPPSPPPPPVTPPPPPPSPSPSECGDFSYCPSDETCCCLFEFIDFCLIYGCCEYENAVCCTGTDYCCPSDYPICDVEEGLCLKNAGDYLGIVAKKRKIAKHKFPWTKIEPTDRTYSYQPLRWKRNRLGA
ncbi:hypothetical protein CDL15_Pgr008677 [Punica granatum]|uniref:Low-temperature-induced cysteine proteinase-like n=1 Tax=Punica granatum TaxID=22663 RepID=A0A218XDL3_PUNGR|nr:hypothetical protein CDL15_Pgr008677 [Punica granatum]PKI61632.1 hypothetical protein CRG98_018007 [Punica granatum]